MAEMLAWVLCRGAGRDSALGFGRPLARRPPAELAAWPAARWLLVPGVGPARAAALSAAFELGRRAAERGASGSPIRGPDDVLAQVRDLPRARKEHFVVLLLNARHEVQRRETVSIGSLNASIVHPREVFLPAILHSAASVVLVHNHPSGDPEPSEEDLSITRRLVQVGELVGIGVLDHVIVAKSGAPEVGVDLGLEGSDPRDLLVHWLNTALLESELRQAVWTRAEVRALSPCSLSGTLAGPRRDARRQVFLREVKAVSHHALDLDLEPGRCRCRVILDI